MPVPKRKRSRARRDKRFANKGLKPQSFTKCPNCTEFIMPHQACKSCGHYKGAKVIRTKSDRDLMRSEAKKLQEAKKPKEEAQTEQK